MINKVLFAWIGKTDLRASLGELGDGLGPIGQAVSKRSFSCIALISNYKKEEEKHFIDWLKTKTSALVLRHHVELSSPTDFKEIYESATNTINEVKMRLGSKEMQPTYHLSPGTPAMAAVWILLSKTSHPAELIESSQEKGVKTVSLPFEISADYVPDILKPADDEILKLTQGLPPESPEFGAIIHRCKEMKRVIAQARRLAVHDVPVLIQGESGTGKELFARAIHTTSPRMANPFVAVNCGSIPPELVESEFFGHTKGGFTGAISDRKGYFSAADGGTLFLDEIGELPLPAQVKLLRAIQEGMITKVGSSKTESINVRIIAATNRNLIEEVASGRFREDLFHRIAVGVLYLPPLRDRHGDLNPAIEHILESINRKFEDRPGWKHKNISAGARNLMHQHPWPGNVRELYNTLSRAAILIAGETIETDDIREALFPVSSSQNNQEKMLNRNLGNGFSLPDMLSDVARHYLKRAVVESKGNKTKIASLLGLSNYQTASNWLKKYGIEE
ncbi:MAG: sigma 54-interacting transcriptional regulator [Nitrospirae bacterium]|nr:sigma 54-interacting transcriptional regulator [Nitrospirota bacterium]